MRDTNQRLKWNGWVLVSFCVLMLLVVLGSCETAGAGGSDDGSESNLDVTDDTVSPGEALVLPEGNISGWSLGTSEDVVVLLMDSSAEVVKGYGPVTVPENGNFPGMSIEPPPAEALLSWAEFLDVYDNTLYEQVLNSFPVDITDNTVRFQTFGFLEVEYTPNVILRGTGDGTAEVSWIYADGSTNISATFNTGDYDVTIDLQLAAGWNRAVIKSDDSSSTVTLKTGESEPAGTGWYLE